MNADVVPDPARRAPIPIISAFDVLFTLVIFNGFAQWHSVQGLVNRVLAILLYLIIINDWMSLRASAKVYNIPIMFLDLCDVFIFVNIFASLEGQNGTILPYQPIFWIYLTVLCCVYSVWDFILAGALEWPGPKTMRQWAWAMAGAGLTCLLTYFGLAADQKYSSSLWHPEILASLIILPAIVAWLSLLGVWTAKKLQEP
jgi:hypothetical protein